MRGILLGGWLLVPVLMGAYHYGPGQRRMELDETQDALRAARSSVKAEDCATAVKRVASGWSGPRRSCSRINSRQPTTS